LPLTKQTFQIIHLAEKYQKPLIILVNKYDLIDTKQKKTIQIQIYNRLKSLRYAPVIFLSALIGKGIKHLLKILSQMLSESQKKFTKNELDKTIESMLIRNPSKYKGGKLKIYFAKYQSGLVHYFIFFVNNLQLVHFSYQRYIINYLRKNLALEYLPIKLIFKKS
jgi:GTP-binding protein